jgi:hypothetical protein
MADSILKLRVEDQEYNAKLRNATAGLNHYISNCRKVGGTLEVVEKDTLDFVQALGKMPTVAQGSTQSLREMTRTVGDLTIMYRGLTDEEKNSPFGQALAQGIQELTSRAGQARDAIDDVQSSIKYAASDTQTFDTLTSSARLMAAGFQVVSGAAKLMGVDMSDNIELQTKLQSAMSVSMGLLQAQNLLQKESAVVQGVDAIKTQANAIAKALLAKNTAAATVAGEAFNAVAKANPYVLIASAAAIAISAMITYARHAQKAAEADKIRTEEADRLRKKQEEMSSAIGTHVGQAEAKYRALQHEWNRLTTVAEKTDFIDKQSQSFKDLGLNITTVADAQKALVDMAPDVINALRAVAEAEAYSDLYKQSIQKHATEWENRVKGVETGDDYIREEVNAKKNWSIIPDEWTAAGLTKQDYNMETMYFMNTMKTMYTLNQAGVDKINQYRADQAKILNEKLKQQYDDEVSYYENKWTEAQNNALAAQGKIGKLMGGGTTTTVVPDQSFPIDSLPQLTQHLKDLKAAQDLSLNPRQWAEYQQKINQTQYMIDAFKGQWKEGLTATFTIDDAQVLSELDKIEGIEVQDKTVTVNTVEAYQKVNEMVSNIQDKDVTFTVTPQVVPLDATNIHNSAGLNTYINGLRQELANADFGTVLYDNLTSKLADANMLKNLLEQSLSIGLGTALFDKADELGQTFWDRVLSPAGVADADWEAIAAAINVKLEELGLDPITIDVNTGRVSGSGKSTADNGDVWEHAEEIVSGMSQVSSGLDRMGIELPQAVQDGVNTMQGMIQTINGIQAIAHGLGTTAPAMIQAAATGVQSAIALLIQALNLNTASNAAAATGNVAETAIDILMAHGGIVPHAAHGYAVPGTHYSGDTTPILANAGELILNKAQQGNIASQLQDNESETGGRSIQPYVSGDKVFLGINNYLRGAGYGELITTNYLRRIGLIH